MNDGRINIGRPRIFELGTCLTSSVAKCLEINVRMLTFAVGSCNIHVTYRTVHP